MNPLVLALLGRLLAPQGIPAGQGPQGVAQGRHGEKGPAAAQRSPRNRMMQNGVNPGVARRLTGPGQQGPQAPMPGQNPQAMLAPLLAALSQHGRQAPQGPPPPKNPILNAMMNSPLLRGRAAMGGTMKGRRGNMQPTGARR